MKKVLISHSGEETKSLGVGFARYLLKLRLRGEVVLGLVGEMGSGKTTFVQGLTKGMGIKGRIISPTFVLMRSYQLKGQQSFKIFHHVDLYRLEGNDIGVLGLEGLWKSPRAVVVVEWADKIRGLMPCGTIWISFSSVGEDEREIIIEGDKQDAFIY